MKLSKFTLKFVFFILISTNAIADSSMVDFLNSFKQCNLYFTAKTFNFKNSKVTIIASPQSFCLFKLESNAQTDKSQPIDCSVSEQDVAVITSPDRLQQATQYDQNPDSFGSKEFQTLFKPIIDSCNAKTIQNSPPVQSTPPPGAVPFGTPLPLPPGYVPMNSTPSQTIPNSPGN